MTGRFVLNDLPVGVHVPAVSIDGSHMTFQQQANLVADPDPCRNSNEPPTKNNRYFYPRTPNRSDWRADQDCR